MNFCRLDIPADPRLLLQGYALQHTAPTAGLSVALSQPP